MAQLSPSETPMDRSERDTQLAYWKAVGSTTVEGMMLDSKAKDLDVVERPEILQHLPLSQAELASADVIELGAGTGRFTGHLATQCQSVLAVDFLQECVDANDAAHGHLGNIEYRCCDVNDLELPSQSADMVFSNWLLMYLSDDEVRQFAGKALAWTRPGGFITFRESCYHASGDASRPTENPTHYRTPEEYETMFLSAEAKVDVEVEDGDDAPPATWKWQLVERARVRAYEVLKNNPNQIRWVYKKVNVDDADSVDSAPVGDDHPTSEQLDATQYTETGILRYERIFGAGFVSTGGLTTTSEFVARLGLKPGMRVLDVGCGIGGGDLYMAETFGVEVVGIDLSRNMVNIAIRRAADAGCRDLVTYEVRDATTTTFEPESFDVIYSRDTLLHIGGKDALFRRFLGWLKPGGQLFISDYARAFPAVPAGDAAAATTCAAFEAYVAQRGYHLMTPERYGEVVLGAGFASVDEASLDSTELFVASLKRELATTEAMREAFVAEFSEEDYEYIVSGWRKKLEFTGAGLQKWAVIHARKAE